MQLTSTIILKTKDYFLFSMYACQCLEKPLEGFCFSLSVQNFHSLSPKCSSRSIYSYLLLQKLNILTKTSTTPYYGNKTVINIAHNLLQ